MDHDQLLFDIRNSPSLRLLRSESAPLLASFLHRMFKREQRVAIPLRELTEGLENYLELLSEQHAGLYPRSATAYIKQWSDDEHRFLRVYTRSEETFVELTADTERAIGWLEELRGRAFVGTESRFLHIFELLEEIIVRSTENAEARLIQLERERAAIEQEIATIRATGQVIAYTGTQLKERFLQASETARQLLRDFSMVEDNFRTIARSVQEQGLRPEARKGSVVSYVLDADQQLKESDQGRSFYTFWEFLLSPAKQDELHSLIEGAFRVPALADVTRDGVILRRLTRSLIDAGEKIVQSNHRLAEQLRRLLDERTLAESRRARELITEVKALALRVVDHPPSDEAFLVLEGSPVIELVMEKPLWEPTNEPIFAAVAIEPNDHVLDAEVLRRLYAQVVVDDVQLRGRIEVLLENRRQISLAELLVVHPVQQGLAELLAYLAIAARDTHHTIDEATHDMVTLRTDSDGRMVHIAIPHVLFRSRTNAR